MLAALAAVALVVGVVGSTVSLTEPHQGASHTASQPVVTVHGVQTDDQKASEHKTR
ncbi:MAG: hypothetical protein WCA32_00245 [Chromatiaceae bacterium]